MKSLRRIPLLLLSAVCLVHGSAMAQPRWGDGPCRDGDRGCQRDGGRGEFRHDGPRDERHDGERYGAAERHDEDRGAGPEHAFHRGDRLPTYYRGRQYVVDDWRGHGLHAPPRGYHWVPTGGDYVLVAVTTGVILELLLGH